MRIEYGRNSVGKHAAYVRYYGDRKLGFNYTSAPPELVAPYEQTAFEVSVYGIGAGQPVTETGQLHYTINDGDLASEPLIEVAPNLYQGNLPALECDDVLNYYVSAEEVEWGRIAECGRHLPHTAYVGTQLITLFQDDFETDQGWTVSGSAMSGHWERGVPAGDGTQGDPTTDFDGSGNCYLTGNAIGPAGVEYGYTELTSPTIDMSTRSPWIHFARWFLNCIGTEGYEGEMIVYLSNDNGSNWVYAERLGLYATSRGQWYEHDLRVTDYLTPTSEMKVRFHVLGEAGSFQIVEGAVDDILAIEYDCKPYICGDANDDESVNIGDVVYLVNLIFHDGPMPVPQEAGDVNCDGSVNVGDAVYMANYIFQQDAPVPCAACP